MAGTNRHEIWLAAIIALKKFCCRCIMWSSFEKCCFILLSLLTNRQGNEYQIPFMVTFDKK